MMRRNGIALVALLLLAGAAPAASRASETRCGWLDNPTPQNFWLRDRAGEWVLSTQGGRVADGFDNLPDMSTKGVKQTNGSYGYSCACITGIYDAKTHEVLRVTKGKPKPLRQCRADRHLPRM